MKRTYFLVMLVTAIILSVVKTNSMANDEKIRPDIVSRTKRVCERCIWVFRADGTATVTDTVNAEELLKGIYRFKGSVLTLYREDDDNA